MTAAALHALATATSTPARVKAGRVLTAIPVLFLAFDAAIKFSSVPAVAESMGQLGWSASQAPLVGVIEFVCLAIYLIPRTSVLGAVLLTGYLGGAVATHVRVEHPLFSHTLFPIYLAVFIWAGLVLRDRRVRAAFRLAA